MSSKYVIVVFEPRDDSPLEINVQNGPPLHRTIHEIRLDTPTISKSGFFCPSLYIKYRFINSLMYILPELFRIFYAYTRNTKILRLWEIAALDVPEYVWHVSILLRIYSQGSLRKCFTTCFARKYKLQNEELINNRKLTTRPSQVYLMNCRLGKTKENWTQSNNFSCLIKCGRHHANNSTKKNN
jgi:hypothetical protein